jgi:hypothetical protein
MFMSHLHITLLILDKLLHEDGYLDVTLLEEVHELSLEKIEMIVGEFIEE